MHAPMKNGHFNFDTAQRCQSNLFQRLLFNRHLQVSALELLLPAALLALSMQLAVAV
jgi:hypothetical protein